MGLDREASKSASDGRATMAVECFVPDWKTVLLVVEGGTQLMLFEENLGCEWLGKPKVGKGKGLQSWVEHYRC